MRAVVSWVLYKQAAAALCLSRLHLWRHVYRMHRAEATPSGGAVTVFCMRVATAEGISFTKGDKVIHLGRATVRKGRVPLAVMDIFQVVLART